MAKKRNEKLPLMLALLICFSETSSDVVLVSAVEYGSHNVPAESLTSHTEVNFKHLSDIHS